MQIPCSRKALSFGQLSLYDPDGSFERGIEAELEWYQENL